jgi:hypothetical protein
VRNYGASLIPQVVHLIVYQLTVFSAREISWLPPSLRWQDARCAFVARTLIVGTGVVVLWLCGARSRFLFLLVR